MKSHTSRITTLLREIKAERDIVGVGVYGASKGVEYNTRTGTRRAYGSYRISSGVRHGSRTVIVKVYESGFVSVEDTDGFIIGTTNALDAAVDLAVETVTN